MTDDGGGHWVPAGAMPIDAQTPERPSFEYRAPRDGEYWLTVQTVDTRGRLFPPLDADVEPQLKVIVNTVAPSISLEALPRRGSTCAVRWEAIDDHLLTSSIRLEFQADGPNGGWRTVPLHRPARIGDERWDSGTSEPFKVRLSASDRAGNVKTVALMMPDGLPSAGGFGGVAPGRSNDGDPVGEAPPPRGAFVSSETERGPSASPSPVIPGGPPPMPGFGAMGEGAGGVNPFDVGEAPMARAARPGPTTGPPTADPAASEPSDPGPSPKFAHQVRGRRRRPQRPGRRRAVRHHRRRPDLVFAGARTPIGPRRSRSTSAARGPSA